MAHIVYVLYFNEWGWDEGDENQGHILGVFEDKNLAKSHEELAKKENNHGFYSVKEVLVDSFSRYGW